MLNVNSVNGRMKPILFKDGLGLKFYFYEPGSQKKLGARMEKEELKKLSRSVRFYSSVF